MPQNNLYNVQTGRAEVLPENAIHTAIASGTHAFRRGTKINVVDQNGESFSLPAEELPRALSEGYSLETAMDGAVKDYVEDNKGLAGQLKTFGTKAVSEAAFGLPEVIYDHTADPLEIAKREALKEENAIANAAGAVTGFGASLLYGGPVFKGAAAAGRVAESLVAKKLAQAGIERGSEALSKKLLAGAATKAAAMGTEGVVLAAPRAVTEAALGDTEAAGESLLWGLGIGTGLGLAGGAMTPAFRKIKDKYETIRSSLTKSTEPSWQKAAESQGIKPNAVSDDTLASAVPESEPARPSILSELGKKKANAAEIKTAFKDLNLEPVEGAISSSKFIQDMDSALRKKVSTTGIARAEKYGRILDTVEQTARTALASDAAESAIGAGDQIKAKIREGVEERYRPFEDAYAKIRDEADKIGIPDERRLKFYDRLIEKSQSVGSKGSEASQHVRDLAERVLSQNTVKDMDALLVEIRAQGQAARQSGRFDIADALGTAKNEVEDFVDSELISQAKRLEKDGVDDAKTMASEFIKSRKTTKSGYAQFKSFMEDLGESTKTRSKGIKGFVEAIEETPSEKLVDKMFDKKNARALEFLKKEMPGAFDALVGFKKAELLRKSTKDGRLQLGAFFRDASTLSPELQKLMLEPQQLQKLKAAKTVFEALPKDVNPSGTARAMEFNQMFNPANPLDWAGLVGRETGDAAKEAFIKRVVDKDGVLFAEQAMKRAGAEMDRIPPLLRRMGQKVKDSKGSGGTTAGGIALGTSLTSDPITRLMEKKEAKRTKDELFREFTEKTSQFAGNPDLLMEKLAEVTAPIGEMGAPGVSAVLSDRLVKAGQYLYSEIPKSSTPDSPFFKSAWRPSDADMASFERKLDTVLEPFSVIDHLGNGTLTRDHVLALNATYPRLASLMREKIVNTVSENPGDFDYQARLKLSLLLGMNLDPSLTPQFMQSLGAAAAPQNQHPAGPKDTGASSLTLAQRTEMSAGH